MYQRNLNHDEILHILSLVISLDISTKFNVKDFVLDFKTTKLSDSTVLHSIQD